MSGAGIKLIQTFRQEMGLACTSPFRSRSPKCNRVIPFSDCCRFDRERKKPSKSLSKVTSAFNSIEEMPKKKAILDGAIRAE